jgi:toxin-antitoxin system PIN domain toxin
VIVPDVNLLLYATISGFPEHTRARRWWEELLGGDNEVGLAAPALFGFVRICTNPRIFDRPLAVDDAVTRVEEWLDQPSVRFLQPGPRHIEIAFRLLRQLGAASNLTTDVQLAAHAIENQAEVQSNDGEFARFPDLRWSNPIA